jgi:hypothetical protein
MNGAPHRVRNVPFFPVDGIAEHVEHARNNPFADRNSFGASKRYPVENLSDTFHSLLLSQSLCQG